MADCPVTYLIFDLLYLDGRSLVDLPYAERRERLDALELEGPSWQTPSHHRGEGKALLGLTEERGLEGLVAKRLDSRYLPGRRSRAWLKVKNIRSQELVIGGWLPGQGRREGTIGAILVGYHEDDDARAAAALRRPGRQRLHRGRAAAPRRPARAPRDAGEPLRGPPAAEAGRLRRAPPGGRGRLPRMDCGPNPARPRLQGAANRQGPGGGRPGTGGAAARAPLRREWRR